MNISEINIYPIKSLKGISLDSAVVEERGLRFDRRWMLTDPAGRFMTQREHPRMATINVEVKGDGLLVTADDITSLRVPFSAATLGVREVTVWDSTCPADVYGEGINGWFSQVLGLECQLVHMPDTSRRHVSERFDRGGDVVSFADGYPLLVIGEASLADLNGRIARNAEKEDARGTRAFQSLPMNRFRPNIVVSGSEAFAEDDWQQIRVGDAVFRSTKPCARCVMTTVDQTAGEPAGKEPLKTLADYRMAKNVMPERFESLGLNGSAVLFGQNLIAETFGSAISVGDEVEVFS